MKSESYLKIHLQRVNHRGDLFAAKSDIWDK